MYIKRRAVSALYRVFVAVLAGVGLACILMSFGHAAWRLYSTWVMLVAAIYYIVSSLVIAFSRKRSPGRMLCPMLHGASLISGLILLVMRIVISAGGMHAPAVSGFGGVIIYFIVPILLVIDWLLFCKKGQWRVAEPGYWLAFPIIYCCAILLSAAYSPRNITLRYPYEFLDYSAIGIDTMAWWGILLVVMILAVGYAVVMLDSMWSGKLAKHIVMPRIKTIVIEEEIIEETDEPEDTPTATTSKQPAKKNKPERKPENKSGNKSEKSKKTAKTPTRQKSTTSKKP